MRARVRARVRGRGRVRAGVRARVRARARARVRVVSTTSITRRGARQAYTPKAGLLRPATWLGLGLGLGLVVAPGDLVRVRATVRVSCSARRPGEG